MDYYLVRIKPSIPCDSYNEFFKAKGWHKVDKSKAQWCATRRISDLSPDAPLVFDVMSETEASLTASAELLRVDPSGTPEAPIDLRSRAANASDIVSAQRAEHAALLEKMQADMAEAELAKRALEDMRAEATRISELSKKVAAERAAAAAELTSARAEAESFGVLVDGEPKADDLGDGTDSMVTGDNKKSRGKR